MNAPTPHLEGTRGDYAPNVLLPGDPKRARFIADTYLSDVRQVNSVRGADGFTGDYNGTPVSVQSVGMGVPSAAIYYTELIRFFGCEKLIRVGSCGGITESVGLGDVIVATAAGTDSAAIQTINGGMNLPSVASWPLFRSTIEAAERLDLPVSVGPVFTSDLFYGPSIEPFETMQQRGVLGVEMEIAVLYALAAAEGAEAVGLITVSDDIVRGTAMTPDERATTFDKMMRIALEAL